MSNPFCYVELHTDALEEALAFYSKVFDWKTREIPGMGGYHSFSPKKGVGGGIGPKQDPAAPNHWLPYVEVADVKKTMGKAEKLGAKPVLPFMVLPNMGSIGIFLDPSGAVLGVWAPGEPVKEKADKKKEKKEKKAKKEAKAKAEKEAKAKAKAEKDAKAEKEAKAAKAKAKAEKDAKRGEKKASKSDAKPAKKASKKAAKKA